MHGFLCMGKNQLQNILKQSKFYRTLPLGKLSSKLTILQNFNSNNFEMGDKKKKFFYSLFFTFYRLTVT